MFKMKITPTGWVISIILLALLLLLSLTHINRSYLDSSHIVSWRSEPSKCTWSSTCKLIIKYTYIATLLYHLATILLLQFSYRMVHEWRMGDVWKVAVKPLLCQILVTAYTNWWKPQKMFGIWTWDLFKMQLDWNLPQHSMICGIFITMMKGTLYNKSHLWHQSRFKTGSCDACLNTQLLTKETYFPPSGSFQCKVLTAEFLIMAFFSKNI